MNKCRILQFPIRYTNGGITHYAMSNWQYMDKERFECDFATVSKKPICLENKIKAMGAKLRYITDYAEENRNSFIKQIKSVLIDGKYDVVHLHTSFWKSFLVEELALECGVPKIIVHSHSTQVDIDDPVERSKAERIHNIRKLEFTPELATDFWACSTPAADWLYGPQIPREKIVLVKNAIDIERFAFNVDVRRLYRQKNGVDNCFVLGAIGRMSHTKNHRFLIEVFADLLNIKKNLRLILVGNGELYESLYSLSEELNITENILFLGQREDVESILQMIDVFCLPSIFEGLPISAIEAQAAGLKCLVSENITREVRITDNIEFIPLLKSTWIDAILKLSEGYERTNTYDQVDINGYNIKSQIKKVERMYMQ